MNSKRALSGSARLVRAALRTPSAVIKVLPAVLDEEFNQRSPIPRLPPSLYRSLGQFSVVLPALSTLEPGNQNWIGLSHLVCLAKAIQATSIFEIGTYNGVTALTLARNLPVSRVHTLDLPNSATPKLPTLASDPGNYSRFLRRAYEGEPEESRIVQHLGDSATFGFAAFRRACQLVYVDGAHSTDYVQNDTRVAFELVADDGVIVWDDYWRPIPDVAGVLNSLRIDRIYRLPESRLVAWFSAGAHTLLSQEAGEARV